MQSQLLLVCVYLTYVCCVCVCVCLVHRIRTEGKEKKAGITGCSSGNREGLSTVILREALTVSHAFNWIELAREGKEKREERIEPLL